MYINNQKKKTTMSLSLTQIIQQINQPKITQTKLLKSTKRIVKALYQYVNDSQKLPPQTLIPCALFILPQKISRHLLELQPQEILAQPSEKLSIDLLIQLYLKTLLKLVEESSTEILHVIVEGMSRNTNLLHAYPIITKKWLKTIVKLWSQSQQNLNLSLRCHMLIQKYLSNASVQMFSWVLRRMYVAYFDNAKQVSWRNYQHINFMINSFCQILKINQSRSYYVLFGYIRSIALQLDKFNKSKGKQKIEQLNKLYSNQILSCFKIFSAVVSRNISQQFSSLIYPLIQIMTAFCKLTQSAQFLPLKLKIIDFTLQITQSLNIFIPVTFQLLQKILSNKIFIKKINKKGQNVADNIQIIYRLSPNDLSNAQLVNYMFKSAIVKVYRFIYLSLRNVYGIQIVQKVQKMFKNLKQEYHYTGFKIQLTKGIKLLTQDIDKLYNLRKKSKMSINEQNLILSYENKRVKNNYKLSSINQYQKLRQEEESMIKNKLLAQKEEQIGEEKENESLQQDQDQLQNGWQQASQGASQFQQQPQGQNQDDSQQARGQSSQDQKESISYQGDPQDADQAAMQWSQHSWSSQNQMDVQEQS